MIRFKMIAILFALAATTIGCATATQSGFLKDYDILQDGSYLEKYWSDKSTIERKKYSKIRIEKIDVTRISDKKGVTAQDCAVWLKSALTENAGELRADVTFMNGDIQTDAMLYIGVTEMTPGSAAGRIFAGEVGMGNAFVQVEGRIVDIESGKEIMAFADRRRSSGATGLEDLGGDAGPRLVRRMLGQIAADLFRELKQSGF